MPSLKEKISTRVKNKYRLILRHDENLEEKVSLVLTPLNLLLVAAVGLMVFGTINFLLLAYTPLNSILPYSTNRLSSTGHVALIQRIDSLEHSLDLMRQQSDVLQEILETESGAADEVMLQQEDYVVPEQKVSAPVISTNTKKLGPQNYSFYVPIKGVISDTFNIERKHLAVDIAAKNKSVIKSVQRGTVIYSDWSPKTGHTMVIQHPNDFISVYKHGAVLLKKEGTFVNAGEAIALVGNTGELSNGPHCHFELWNGGVAVDPTNYIRF